MMKKYNTLEKTGFILIVIGVTFAILSLFTKIQFRSEGVFVSSIGLIILALGSSKKKKEQKEK